MDSPRARPPGSTNWRQVLWHEFVHVITLQLSKGQVPRWLTEGLSVYEEKSRRDRWGRDMERQLYNRWHNGRLLKMAKRLNGDVIADVDFAAQSACRHDMDAIIATNTTIARAGIENLRHADQNGGLSGAPLRERATTIVGWLSESLAGQLPIIAVGGIMSAADAVEKVAAGASLIQLYTGLIYRGPRLVSECAHALHTYLREHR